MITREGIKPDPKKIQGIVDIRIPTTTTEARALIGMVQYYSDMWPRRSHTLDPFTESARVPKGRNILFNDALEYYSTEIKRLVSEFVLLGYPDRTIPFTVHADTSDKHLGAVISQNNKPI